MQRRTPKLLHDIHQAAAAIQGWTASRSLDDYRGDPMLRAAVERNFEVMGEALNRLARFDVESAAQLGPYEQIIAFRNVLIHGYDIIEHERVWRVIENDLPPLVASAKQLLRTADE